MDTDTYEDTHYSSDGGDDGVDKLIFEAVIKALKMKDQMAISIQNIEDLLQQGKNLYFKNNDATENSGKQPSKWVRTLNTAT